MVDRQLASKISALTLDGAVDFLAKQAVLSKAAAPSLAEFSELLANPVRQMTGGKTVPHVPMEVLRNALIGLGVGGLGTMVDESLKPEHERRRGRVVDNALLGGVLGAGGTLAYRHLGHSGDPAKPARYQKSLDAILSPEPKTEGAKKLDDIVAPQPSASTTAPVVAPEDTTVGKWVIDNPNAPATLRRMGAHVARNDYGQAATTAVADLSKTIDVANHPVRALASGYGAYKGTTLGWGLTEGKPAKTWIGHGAKTTGRLGAAGLGGAVGAYLPTLVMDGFDYLTKPKVK